MFCGAVIAAGAWSDGESPVSADEQFGGWLAVGGFAACVWMMAWLVRRKSPMELDGVALARLRSVCWWAVAAVGIGIAVTSLVDVSAAATPGWVFVVSAPMMAAVFAGLLWMAVLTTIGAAPEVDGKALNGAC